ncbi:MAG: hypothetical protein HC849_11950 [Oscillatoriales cyanobacterium RU_3_3]|nr:hypothetical protein [Oscillatoriales cyanobacterium RU_3_3]NJR25737.1 hypothetical protein [Richelia sp. CSU_2_1]
MNGNYSVITPALTGIWCAVRTLLDCTLYQAYLPIEQSSQGHGTAVSLPAISGAPF